MPPVSDMSVSMLLVVSAASDRPATASGMAPCDARQKASLHRSIMILVIHQCHRRCGRMQEWRKLPRLTSSGPTGMRF